jgi:hypothetical protein
MHSHEEAPQFAGDNSSAYQFGMSTEVIKTVKNRRYRYAQRSYREGGKVKTKSVYIGPVDGRVRRPKFSIANLLMGGLAFGAHLAKNGTKTPTYRDRERGVDPRTFEKMSPKEQQMELVKGRHRAQDDSQRAEWYRYGPGSVPNTRGARAARAWFKEEARAHKAAKQAEVEKFFNADRQKATAPPAPAKNFSVDDEIEAPQATFERAVEEYNVGTQAAPATEAPPDAPNPDASVGQKE